MYSVIQHFITMEIVIIIIMIFAKGKSTGHGRDIQLQSITLQLTQIETLDKLLNLLIFIFLKHKMRYKIIIYLRRGCMDCMREYVICLALCLEILNIQYLLIIIVTHKAHANSVNIVSNPHHPAHNQVYPWLSFQSTSERF